MIQERVFDETLIEQVDELISERQHGNKTRWRLCAVTHLHKIVWEQEKDMMTSFTLLCVVGLGLMIFVVEQKVLRMVMMTTALVCSGFLGYDMSEMVMEARIHMSDVRCQRMGYTSAVSAFGSDRPYLCLDSQNQIHVVKLNE